MLQIGEPAQESHNAPGLESPNRVPGYRQLFPELIHPLQRLPFIGMSCLDQGLILARGVFEFLNLGVEGIRARVLGRRNTLLQWLSQGP